MKIMKLGILLICISLFRIFETQRSNLRNEILKRPLTNENDSMLLKSPIKIIQEKLETPHFLQMNSQFHINENGEIIYCDDDFRKKTKKPLMPKITLNINVNIENSDPSDKKGKLFELKSKGKKASIPKNIKVTVNTDEISQQREIIDSNKELRANLDELSNEYKESPKEEKKPSSTNKKQNNTTNTTPLSSIDSITDQKVKNGNQDYSKITDWKTYFQNLNQEFDS